MKQIAAAITLTMLAIANFATAAELVKPDAFDEWREKHPDAVLLDIRTPEEFATGHIPGARLVTWGSDDDFTGRVRAIAKPDQPVLLICRSGRRTVAAGKALQAAGFTTLSDLQGGMLAWKRSGERPVEKPEP